MARPQIHGEVAASYSCVFYEEEKTTVEGLEEIRKRKGFSKTDVIKAAIKAYVKANS